jgi:hypothetical protein
LYSHGPGFLETTKIPEVGIEVHVAAAGSELIVTDVAIVEFERVEGEADALATMELFDIVVSKGAEIAEIVEDGAEDDAEGASASCAELPASRDDRTSWSIQVRDVLP